MHLLKTFFHSRLLHLISISLNNHNGVYFSLIVQAKIIFFNFNYRRISLLRKKMCIMQFHQLGIKHKTLILNYVVRELNSVKTNWNHYNESCHLKITKFLKIKQFRVPLYPYDKTVTSSLCQTKMGYSSLQTDQFIHFLVTF